MTGSRVADGRHDAVTAPAAGADEGGEGPRTPPPVLVPPEASDSAGAGVLANPRRVRLGGDASANGEPDAPARHPKEK
jgi:hypothetical protein